MGKPNNDTTPSMSTNSTGFLRIPSVFHPKAMHLRTRGFGRIPCPQASSVKECLRTADVGGYERRLGLTLPGSANTAS